MIRQITQVYQLTPQQDQIIQSLIPFQYGILDRNDVKAIMEDIHDQLLQIQSNDCCYCGLKVNEGGRAEIDHIAKHGGLKRPAYIEFLFTPQNLAISCQYCNSSSKKGQTDVLENVDLTNYRNCTFNIVHPYFDDPSIHYEWTNGRYRILISALSDKGKYSVELFELASEGHTMARAKQAMFERKLSRYQQRQAIKQRIIDIVKFRNG
jgi:uncharacterized protein (TIGR02646 family)